MQKDGQGWKRRKKKIEIARTNPYQKSLGRPIMKIKLFRFGLRYKINLAQLKRKENEKKDLKEKEEPKGKSDEAQLRHQEEEKKKKAQLRRRKQQNNKQGWQEKKKMRKRKEAKKTLEELEEGVNHQEIKKEERKKINQDSLVNRIEKLLYSIAVKWLALTASDGLGHCIVILVDIKKGQN